MPRPRGTTNAILLAKPDFIHTAAMERRLVDALASAGLIDAVS